nr:serine/threonine-protein kinase [Salsipaludibacter albus]
MQDWEVLEQVGVGSTAVVHRAVRRDRPGRVVALKRLRDTGSVAVDDLEREAAVLADLSHPAIAVLHEVVVEPDEVVLVLALATGGSLAERLARRGSLPWPEVVDLGARLADGLAAAHHAGVVHRDVKPSNVLYGREDEPRLADFGLARVRDDHDDRVAGTSGYLDPDVVAGGVPGPRADQWSLGVVLWEALAGHHPFAAADAAATTRAADRGGHLPLADLVPDAPPDLVSAIERAMARDPADRFATTRDLHGALAAVDTSGGAGSGVVEERGKDVAGGAPRSEAPGSDEAGSDEAGSHAAGSVRGGSDGVGSTARPAPTTTWGPRPPRSEPGPAPRSRRWPVRMAVCILLLVPLVAAGWAVVRTRGDAAAARTDPGVRPVLDPLEAWPTWPPRSVPPPCPTSRPGSLDGPVDDHVGGSRAADHVDVDARGCSVAVHTVPPGAGGRGVVLVVEGTGPVAGRWEVDLVAREVLFGDWDGDGDDTPAVVDDSGAVWVFPEWAEVPARRTDVRADEAVGVVTDGRGRDHVVAVGTDRAGSSAASGG